MAHIRADHESDHIRKEVRLVKRALIISMLLCAVWLTGATAKPLVIRRPLTPVRSKPEVVRHAETARHTESHAWELFEEYISLGEMEYDAAGDRRGTEGAGIGGSVSESEENAGGGADIYGADTGAAEDHIEAAGSADPADAAPGGTDEADPEGAEAYCGEAEIEPDQGENGSIEEQIAADPQDETTSGPVYIGDYTITFYCPCEQCCGRWAWSNCTASGAVPQAGHTVAAGESLPFGTELYIEEFGYYTVEDRGVPDGWIDIYVNDHSEIPSYGMTSAAVYKMG